jgi:hypothetical protein
MSRPGLLSLRIFFVSVAFASCAAILDAAPGITNDTSKTKEPAPALAVEQVRVPFPGLSDEVAMVLVGTALIALAAAVRRAH